MPADSTCFDTVSEWLRKFSGLCSQGLESFRCRIAFGVNGNCIGTKKVYHRKAAQLHTKLLPKVAQFKTDLRLTVSAKKIIKDKRLLQASDQEPLQQKIFNVQPFNCASGLSVYRFSSLSVYLFLAQTKTQNKLLSSLSWLDL